MHLIEMQYEKFNYSFIYNFTTLLGTFCVGIHKIDRNMQEAKIKYANFAGIAFITQIFLNPVLESFI